MEPDHSEERGCSDRVPDSRIELDFPSQFLVLVYADIQLMQRRKGCHIARARDSPY